MPAAAVLTVECGSPKPKYPWLHTTSTPVARSDDESHSYRLDHGLDECNEDITFGLVPGLFLHPHPIAMPLDHRRGTGPPKSPMCVSPGRSACSADDLAERDDYRSSNETEPEEPLGLITRISSV
jgi:hypothetical protein